MKEAVTIGESRCWERLRTGKEITEQVERSTPEGLGHLENNKNDGFCRQPNNRLAVFFYTQYQKQILHFRRKSAIPAQYRKQILHFGRKSQEPAQDSEMHMLINRPGGRFQRNLDFSEIQLKGDTENINEGKQWNKRKDKRKRGCRTNLNCATAPILA